MEASTKEIIRYYMRGSRGIRATAKYFGLPLSYVGALIHRYKKRYNIR